MDVTPTEVMYQVMGRMTDMACGEAPDTKDMGPGAIKRREARAEHMDLLHRFVGMTMREGVKRYVQEAGGRVAEAPMRHHA